MSDHSANSFGFIEALARRRYGETYDINSIFTVCWPIFQLRLGITIRFQQRLLEAEYRCLQLLAQNRTSSKVLAEWMGLPGHYMQYIVSRLMENKWVEQTQSSSLTVTSKGNEVLRLEGQTIRIQPYRYTVYYDPVCEYILPNKPPPPLLKPSEAYEAEQFVLPFEASKLEAPKPKTDELDSSGLRQQILEYIKSNPSDDTNRSLKPETINEILRIDRIYQNQTQKQFRSDIVAVAMTPRNGDIEYPELAIYDYFSSNWKRLETDILHRLRQVHLKNPWTWIPEEHHPHAHVTEASDRNIPSEVEVPFLSDQEVDILHHQRDIQYDLGNYRKDLEYWEKTETEEQVSIYQEKIKQLEAKLGETRSELGANLEIITTTEHRPFLLKAVQKAKKELILVSAFVNERTLDAKLRKLLTDAICKRQVRVQIAWGLGTKGRGHDAALNRERGEAALKRLRDQVQNTRPDCGHLLQIKRLENHQKFIICDEQFCAWGSFNWLSYRGNKDRGFRHESSTLSRRNSDIKLWRKQAKDLFGQ